MVLTQQERIEPEGFRCMDIFEDVLMPFGLACSSSAERVGHVVPERQESYLHNPISPPFLYCGEALGRRLGCPYGIINLDIL
jgi:hypothetical protein